MVGVDVTHGHVRDLAQAVAVALEPRRSQKAEVDHQSHPTGFDQSVGMPVAARRGASGAYEGDSHDAQRAPFRSRSSAARRSLAAARTAVSILELDWSSASKSLCSSTSS